MVDEYFESSRPGVHIVGELGGMGLIRNAVTQGVQAGERLAETMPRGAGTDVVIVGAGPAGLATALALRAAGRSFRVLEQGTVGGTIAQYPRQKVVMTEMLDLPFYGKVHKKLISKEDLLAIWERSFRYEALSVPELDGPGRIIRGGAARHAQVSAAWEPSSSVRISLLSGLATDLTTPAARRWIGSELAFPDLLASGLMASAGYYEEGGWVAGNTSFIQVIVRSHLAF